MSQNMMSVSSLNTKIKSLLEATFMHTLVEGEVASVTYHTSGHLYFSIKDDKSSIKCVMWRSSVARMKFRIEKGMHIVVEGSVSVYTPRGEYQFQSVRIEPYGQGALALAYEQLKNKLKEKGYFDAQNKKTIPKSIHKLALVTAKDSAALHDMLKIIQKRWPLLEVVIVDTLVQGDKAGGQIAHGLQYADSIGADVVVVGRGGGSAEDLWAFNEEVVAHALYAMQTPVVSAVGHEVDTLISDFVADLRAPTPSAAIEMILPDVNEVLYHLAGYQERFWEQMTQLLMQKKNHLSQQESSLRHFSPKLKLQTLSQKFTDEYKALQRAMKQQLEQKSYALPRTQEMLKQQMHFVLQKKVEAQKLLSSQLVGQNPKHKSKEGWGEVLIDGQRKALNMLKKGDVFVVQDVERKIEAEVLSSTSLM